MKMEEIYKRKSTKPGIIKGIVDQNGVKWIQYGTTDASSWFSLLELQREESTVFAKLSMLPGVTFVTTKSKSAFKEELQVWSDYGSGIVASAPGWNGPVYVVGDRTVIRPRDFTGEVIVTIAGDRKFSPKGDLASWKTSANVIANQTIPMTAIAFALVPPILRFAPSNLLNPALEIVAEPELGKTTAAVFAMSVYAGQPGSHVGGGSNWDLTVNALDDLKLGHRDSLLFLDEMNLAGSTASDQAELLAKAIFKVSGTEGKKRRTDRGPMISTQIAMLTTANTPLLKLISVNAETKAAIASRLVSIRLEKGRPYGVLDSVPEGFTSAQDAVAYLRQAADENFGVAGLAFLQRLANASAKPGKLERFIAARMSLFTKALHERNPEMARASVRVTNTLAITYAAACLARKWRVFPKRLGSFKQAILRVSDSVDFHASHAALNGGRLPATEIIRRYLVKHRLKVRRWRKDDTPMIANAYCKLAGIVRKQKGRTELWISTTRFQDEFHEHAEIIRELRDLGLAKTENGTQPKLTVKTPKSLVFLAPRSYCITLDDKAKAILGSKAA